MFLSKSLRPVLFLKNNYKFTQNINYFNRNLSIFSRNESKTENIESKIDFKLEDFYLPEPPTSPELFESLDPVLTYNHLGEATFQSLGLINNWPTGWVLSAYEYLHVNFELPWWAVIVASSVLIRVVMFPLSIKIRKLNMKSKTVSPLIMNLQKKIELAKINNDMVTASKSLRELEVLITKSGYRPIKSAIYPFLQLPPFLVMMMSLRKMVVLPVASLQTGGLLWFTDLTMGDPYYILPVTNMMLMLLQMEIGADFSKLERSFYVKWAMRTIPFVGIIFTCYFPTSLLLYWWCASVLSVGQLLITKIPIVSRIFDLNRDEVYENFRKPTKTEGFVQGFRKSATEKKTLELAKKAESMDHEQWLKAGTGVIPKTFSYDPTKVKPTQSENR